MASTQQNPDRAKVVHIDRSSPLFGGAAAARIAAWLTERAIPGVPFVVGVTGSVAVGKTSFCAELAQRLRHVRRVETISTDGFLHSNETLAAQGLSRRKGFPESYNAALLSGLLQRVRWGPVEVPGYSHAVYDVDPSLARTIDRPDILLVEGLGLTAGVGGAGVSRLLDALIYIDASEEDLENWFLERFMRLWREAEHDASSFYARFRSMAEPQALSFAAQVWAEINLPNLRDHIVGARELADIVLRKEADHVLRITRFAGRRRPADAWLGLRND
jgi:type I pantothenate kinase